MLVSDDPGGGATVKTAPVLRIGEALRVLRRRTLWIIGSGIVAAGLAFGVGKSLTPRYTATTQLYLDPRDLQVVDRELTPRGQDAFGQMAVVESQARVITSTSVLQRVVERENLGQDPEFSGETPSVVARLLAALRLRPAPAPDLDSGGALDQLDRRVSVRRAERTFVVDIVVWSQDPDKAARLANAVASAYLDEEAGSRALVARRATSALAARLDELRERVRSAEVAVQDYKAKNNLVGTRDVLVSDQQLGEATQQLGSARARIAEARARVDQVTRARQAGPDAGAVAEALSSQTVAVLRAQYAELRRRVSEAENELGPRHPGVRSLRVQLADSRRLVDEELARITRSARNDLERAEANERALSESLETLKRRSIDTGAASVQLRELEREAEASRGLYQSFLVRSRETGEQERLNTTSARVITPAFPPRLRSFPPRVSVLVVLGFVAGAGLGAGAALLGHALQGGAPGTPPLAPRQAPPAPRRRDGGPLVVSLASADLRRGRERAVAGGGLSSAGLPLAGNGLLDTVPSTLRERAGPPGHPLLVAVLGPPAERGVVALNLALAAAKGPEPVLLVDSDRGRGPLARALLGEPKAGSLRPEWMPPAERLRQTGEGVFVLPAAARLSARALGDLLDEQARRGRSFGLVLLDGPEGELLEAAEATVAALPEGPAIAGALHRILDALPGRETSILAAVVLPDMSGETAEREDRRHA